jgi:two-component SAPR family response regulator
MKIVAVDDEIIALEGLMKSIGEVVPSAQLCGFRYSDEALSHIESHGADIAFLDIEMMKMSGVELAEELKKINPRINIIFSTGYGHYRDAAFDMHASGYMTKPITVEKVRKEIQNLRYPVAQRKIKIRTFGNFEATVDGKPIDFKYRKAKEMLAYLIDRNGASCSVGEMTVSLFEEGGHDAYFKSIRKDLIDTLSNLGFEDALLLQRGMLGLNRDLIDCDYFDYLDGKLSLKSAYHNEYMSQYSWAEITHAELDRKAGN